MIVALYLGNMKMFLLLSLISIMCSCVHKNTDEEVWKDLLGKTTIANTNKDKYKDSFLVDSLGKTIYPDYYAGSIDSNPNIRFGYGSGYSINIIQSASECINALQMFHFIMLVFIPVQRYLEKASIVFEIINIFLFYYSGICREICQQDDVIFFTKFFGIIQYFFYSLKV